MSELLSRGGEKNTRKCFVRLRDHRRGKRRRETSRIICFSLINSNVEAGAKRKEKEKVLHHDGC